MVGPTYGHSFTPTRDWERMRLFGEPLLASTHGNLMDAPVLLVAGSTQAMFVSLDVGVPHITVALRPDDHRKTLTRKTR